MLKWRLGKDVMVLTESTTRASGGKKLQAERTYCANAQSQKYVWNIFQGTVKDQCTAK